MAGRGRELKLGFVGDGSLAEAWLSTLTGNGHRIQTIFCYNIQDAELFSKRYNIKHLALSPLHIYSDLDVNLVLIATPPKLIENELREVSKTEKQCLICSLYTAPSPEIVGLFEKKQAFISYPLRMVRAVQEMRNAVELGTLGKISIFEVRIEMPSTLGLRTERFDWMCDAMMGGGVLNCFGSHCIDAILFITKDQIMEVSCRLCTFFPKTERIKGFRTISSDDFCSLQMKTYSGIFASIQCITNEPGKGSFLIKIIGEKASLTFDGLSIVKEGRGEAETENFQFESRMETSRFNKPFEEGTLKQIECMAGKIDLETLSNEMIDLKNHQHMNTVSRIMHAAVASNRSCSWVKIEQAT